MSTDLDARLRSLSELSPPSHAPLGASELHRRATQRRQRSIALRAVPAVVVVVALLAGAFALAGRSTSTDVVVGPPDGTDAADLSPQDRLTLDLARSAADLAHQLDRETILSATYLATEGTAGVDELRSQRQATDRSDAAFHAAVAAASGGSLPPEVDESVRQAVNRLDRLATNRLSTDGFQAPPLSVLEQFSNTTATLVDLQVKLALTSNRIEVLRGLLASGYASIEIAAGNRMAVQLTPSVEVGYFAEWTGPASAPPTPSRGACGDDAAGAGSSCPAYWDALQAQDAQAVGEQNFLSVATGAQKQSYRAAHTGSDHDQLVAAAFDDGFGRNDLRGSAPGSVPIDPATWRRSALDRADRLRSFQLQIIDSIGREPASDPAVSTTVVTAVGTAPPATVGGPAIEPDSTEEDPGSAPEPTVTSPTAADGTAGRSSNERVTESLPPSTSGP
jgi:hypothetical protein